jgi:superfamily II DNA or RNA helicase
LSSKLSTIIDNRNDNTALEALKKLLTESQSLDVASGFFEIGSLLSLDGLWQPLSQIRILMGDEMTRRTKQELVTALTARANDSVEDAKERDDSLLGLDAIRQALGNGKIQAKIYLQAKFHAKAYIFDTKIGQLSNYAIVGSSNFTKPGLTQNIELNLALTEPLYIEALKNWYKELWAQAEDVSEDVIKVLEPHLREYMPFEVWAKALFEYFEGKQKADTTWEESDSIVWQGLSKYQRDGYRNALKIADKWNGALVCDGVGLGKTYIGMMILEYHLQKKHKILLIVPKSARKSVWEESRIAKTVKGQYPVLLEDNVRILNHTDLGRDGTISPERWEYYTKYFDVVIIDEAHHFRHPYRGRGRKLMQLAKNKKLYMLTATPINNSLDDIYHLINYFAQNKKDHFAELGENNLRKRFLDADRKLDEALADGVDIQGLAELEDFIHTDNILKAVLIQRSRAYVTEVEKLDPNPPVFPKRETPQVFEYSLKRVYAGIYNDIRKAFEQGPNPRLNFKIYNPEQFRLEGKDEKALHREIQVIGLIRTLLLKRLESSWKAFEASIEDLLNKMYRFVQFYASDEASTWLSEHAYQWEIVKYHQAERSLEEDTEEDDVLEAPDMDFDPAIHDLNQLLPFVLSDMTQLVTLLSRVYDHFYDAAADPKIQLEMGASKDDKLDVLLDRLRLDENLSTKKVVIFTEFRDTARYLHKVLTQIHQFKDVEELDSTRNIDRERVIKRFAPYYNCTPEELPEFLKEPIQILITTDVLSEGLNLQDSTQIINYDLHWNPVRLMQRIGRVDRRLNLEAEKALGRANEKPLKIFVYNFIPPNELNDLLGLLKRLTGKVLRISKTLGIEAPIGLPDEPSAVLRNFNEKYDGSKSVEEELQIELEKIARQYPELYERLPKLPGRVFSGKQADATMQGIFCAYRFPPREVVEGQENGNGELRWYFWDAEKDKIIEGVENIHKAIRAAHDTKRYITRSWDGRKDARKKIESYIRNSYLRAINADQSYRYKLVCWMEVSE